MKNTMNGKKVTTKVLAAALGAACIMGAAVPAMADTKAKVLTTTVTVGNTASSHTADAPAAAGQSAEVSDYIHGMAFDKNQVLSLDMTPQTEMVGGKAGETVGDKYVITTKVVRDAACNTASIDNVAANTAYIYPGSLLVADSGLVEGCPTPLITPDRAPVDVTLDLNGGGSDVSFRVENPTAASVKAAIDDAVAKWAAKGLSTTAQIEYKVIKADSKTQIDASLGVKGLSDKLGISTDASLKTDKNTYIVQYKQIYFNANVTPGTDVFGPQTTKADLEKYTDAAKPPVMVNHVSYGRTIFFKVETSKSEDEINEAFKYAGSSATVEQKAKFQQTMENSSVSAFVLGGTAQTGTNISFATPDQINDLIASESNFGGADKTAAFPVSYSSIFLKDYSQATVKTASKYVETTRETRNAITVHLEQNGAYVVKEWYVSARPITGYDENRNPVYGDEQDFYREKSVPCGPLGVKNITIPAGYGAVKFGYDIVWGSNWPYDEEVTTRNNLPSSITIRTTGTTYNATAHIDVDGQKTDK